MSGSTSASDRKFHYTVAKVLHWAALVIIVFNLLSGWRLDGFELDIKKVLLMIHSGVGTSIFAIMLFRWWWRRAHNLYTPPGWWKRPSMVIQWVFYPLLLTQAIIGVTVAAFIDYEVLGFGFIPYSSLAADNPGLQQFFLQSHTIMAWILITLVLVHGAERWRMMFVEDINTMNVQEPTKLP